MEILLWGTGKIAGRVADKIKDFSDIDIVGFVDNNVSKAGSFWREKSIIDPKQIIGYKFDILVIACKAVEEISLQIEENGYVKGEKVLSYIEFERMLKRKEWDERGRFFWKKQKICFIGNEETYQMYSDLSKYIFKEHCFVNVENFSEKIDMAEYKIFICPPRYRSDLETDNYQKEIIEIINQSEFYKFNEWKDIFSNDIKLHMGNKNENNTFYVLRVSDPVTGWGNIIPSILQGITYARKRDYIPIVDMKYFQNQYLEIEKYGKENAWEYYFEQISNYTLEEVYSSKNVIISGIYSNGGMEKKYSDIQYNEITKLKFEQAYNKIFPKKQKVLGIVYRGTDYYSAYNHPIPMDVNEYISKIKLVMEKIGYNYIFIATEVQDVIDAFVKEFGEKALYTNQKRYSIDERRLLYKVHFKRDNDAYLKGLEYLEVLELLARCDALLGASIATTKLAELINNGKYEFVSYDIDNILKNGEDMKGK